MASARTGDDQLQFDQAFVDCDCVSVASRLRRRAAYALDASLAKFISQQDAAARAVVDVWGSARVTEVDDHVVVVFLRVTRALRSGMKEGDLGARAARDL